MGKLQALLRANRHLFPFRSSDLAIQRLSVRQRDERPVGVRLFGGDERFEEIVGGSHGGEGSMTTPITLIVAATRANGIGLNGSLPWRLAEELKYFARSLSVLNPVC